MATESTKQTPSQPPSQSPYDVEATPEQREPRKKFVFIDEQNRHKRLKVVKACDGCRKRKIKCDGVTSNNWPCAACKRLNMQCVRPPLHPEQEDEFIDESELYENYGYQQPYPGYMPHAGSYAASYYYQQGGYDPQQQFAGYPPVGFAPTGASAMITPPKSSSASSSEPWCIQSDPAYGPKQCLRSEMTDEELSEQLGDLKISGVGHAPYLLNTGALADLPAMQEEEIELPLPKGAGHQISIPDEMMPSNDRALIYFRFFFDNVHPYVPVLYPPHLYQHWARDKTSISPLILESVFAISSRLLGRHEESARWLELAKRHEEAFKDAPRMSTLQGLLLLLKARETKPSRGYYWRSWMNIVGMAHMAKDLKLDEHHDQHTDEGGCSQPTIDCLIKTRVWHMIYIVELIVGGPQGRMDYVATTESIDFNYSYPLLNQNDPEYKISQQLAPLLSAIRMVRDSIIIFKSMSKRKKDWAIDPGYLDHNARYDRWTKELPDYLKVRYPEDGSAPNIASHYVANLHSYFQLCIIMHHRPQLIAYAENVSEPWQKVMLICSAAAKKICRLQEAILEGSGVPGFLAMQRGINFLIYSVLTSVMIHMVAVTHYNPAICGEAGEYLTRHMRVLEACESCWPEQLKPQIESLRLAFSIDVSKPFELRPDFPGSPRRSTSSTSPTASHATAPTPPTQTITPDYQGQPYSQQPPIAPTRQYSYDDYSTPDSNTLATNSFEQMSYTSDPTVPDTQPKHYSSQAYYNPTPIFQMFQPMMAAPSSDTQPSMSPPDNSTAQPVDAYFPPQQQRMSQSYDPNYGSYSQSMPSDAGYQTTGASMSQASFQPSIYETPQQPVYSPPQQSPPQPAVQHMTADMWRDVVNTAAFGKRRWDGDGGSSRSATVKRAR